LQHTSSPLASASITPPVLPALVGVFVAGEQDLLGASAVLDMVSSTHLPPGPVIWPVGWKFVQPALRVTRKIAVHVEGRSR
jgi:hypothetical protein